MEDHANTTSFHIQLLLKIIDIDKYPFIKMVIENDITEEEYKETLRMLRQLNDAYEKQKKEGLLDFTSLLVHFAGMLNEKLKPDETIRALIKENYYPELLSEFIQIIGTQN